MSGKDKIAFVGLGVMGYPMAGHLAKNDYDKTVFNRTTARADQWVINLGGEMAASPAGAAMNADFISPVSGMTTICGPWSSVMTVSSPHERRCLPGRSYDYVGHRRVGTVGGCRDVGFRFSASAPGLSLTIVADRPLRPRYGRTRNSLPRRRRAPDKPRIVVAASRGDNFSGVPSNLCDIKGHPCSCILRTAFLTSRAAACLI